MQGIIGSLNDIADAFSDLNKVLEGDLIGNNAIELNPDEYEIFDAEEEEEEEEDDAVPNRTNLLNGSV